MKVKVVDLEGFKDDVFSGESILRRFPGLMEDGESVILHSNGNYYFHENGKPVDNVFKFSNSCAFLAPSEMRYVELIDEQESVRKGLFFAWRMK